MASRIVGGAFAFVLLAILLVATTLGVGMLPSTLSASEQTETEHAGTERAETELAGPSATITIYDENGSVLGVVNASVADEADERYAGLSPYESLANGSGKLFVYDEQDDHAYVMRKMDFPLDIVFIGADERINVIHEAPLPPEGTSGSDLERYTGEGQWVLEVPRGWMAAQEIEEGDRVEIEYRESPIDITTVPGET